MGLQQALQIAEQCNLGKIDGILKFSGAIKIIHDELTRPGEKSKQKFRDYIKKHLNVTTNASYAYLGIEKNRDKISTFRNYLPAKINILYGLCNVEKDVINQAIKTGDINPSMDYKELLNFKRELPGYNPRKVRNKKVKPSIYKKDIVGQNNMSLKKENQKLKKKNKKLKKRLKIIESLLFSHLK